MNTINDNAQLSHMAVIYCRVASTVVSRKGIGIASQERRCREYAGSKGYAVERMFWDVGASGNNTDRDGLQEMLSFLDANAGHGGYVVVVDDDTRLARSAALQFELTDAIAKTGARLECADPAVSINLSEMLPLLRHRPQ